VASCQVVVNEPLGFGVIPVLALSVKAIAQAVTRMIECVCSKKATTKCDRVIENGFWCSGLA
jgi:hypothetical protein